MIFYSLVNISAMAVKVEYNCRQLWNKWVHFHIGRLLNEMKAKYSNEKRHHKEHMNNLKCHKDNDNADADKPLSDSRQ